MNQSQLQARTLGQAERTWVDVSECRDCGELIAWVTSRRTGKRYPCQVYGGPEFWTKPWEPHFKHCQSKLRGEASDGSEDTQRTSVVRERPRQLCR